MLVSMSSWYLKRMKGYHPGMLSTQEGARRLAEAEAARQAALAALAQQHARQSAMERWRWRQIGCICADAHVAWRRRWGRS